MSEWLGINGYALKDTVMSFVSSSEPDLQLAQHVAGHTTQTNTRRYTREALIAAKLEAVGKIIIPGLQTCFGQFEEDYLKDYYKSLTN